MTETRTTRPPSTNGAQKTRPPGVVGVIAQDTARFSTFAASLTGLDVPAGTTIKWVLGHSIAANANDLARTMLATPDAEWLWVLGDDHVFGAQILNRLLDHEAEIVVPLCLSRMPPYKPVMMAGFVDHPDAPEGMRRRVDLAEHRGGGLIEIHSAGSAGMLIRRRVLEAMDDPWFEAGRSASVEIGEDFYFCDKARDAGFAIYGDLDTMLGHTTVATVWPSRLPEGWTFGFGLSGGFRVTMPVGTWDDTDAPNQKGT